MDMQKFITEFPAHVAHHLHRPLHPPWLVQVTAKISGNAVHVAYHFNIPRVGERVFNDFYTAFEIGLFDTDGDYRSFAQEVHDAVERVSDDARDEFEAAKPTGHLAS